ncbi:MAG: complex I NDUFA9 subunit family protein [Caulobacteraceae bacterium]|nr:complex I NDUFA9 subunit family protein [Caulobacteraceae bacterium]
MQGLVAVFGGSGFLGAQVVRALAKRGHRIRVAVRRPGHAYRMRMLGDVGQIEIIQANVRAPQSVARALDGAQACVNLVGVLHEGGRQKFQSIHAMGAQNVAEAAAAAGVTRLIQVSAIGADADSNAKYARTKALGEAAVLKAFPGATIVRPSIVFGQGDSFFNRFANMATLSPVLPLIGGGATRFQPVFVGDVANALANALADPATAGKVYELGGPGIFTFKALMELIVRETGRRPILLPLPFPIAGLIGAAAELTSLVGIAPALTKDQVELLKTDNVVSPGALGLKDLGVVPTSVEAIVPSYLFRYRRGGQYADALVSES